MTIADKLNRKIINKVTFSSLAACYVTTFSFYIFLSVSLSLSRSLCLSLVQIPFNGEINHGANTDNNAYTDATGVMLPRLD